MSPGLIGVADQRDDLVAGRFELFCQQQRDLSVAACNRYSHSQLLRSFVLKLPGWMRGNHRYGQAVAVAG